MNTNKIILISSLCFVGISTFIACNKKPYNLDVLGYAPVYESFQTTNSIASLPPKNYSSVGKIYQNGNTTYQIDNGTGIHVIDCSNVQSPKKIAFINIKGISEMAIKGDVLYADNQFDLVAIDISNIYNVFEIAREKNAYNLSETQTPPYANTYFECVDANKGVVIAWEAKQLHNPKCKTF